MFWSLLCVRMPTYFGALIVVTQGVCRLAIVVCLAELALMASPFPATAHGKHAQPMLPSKGGFCRHRAPPCDALRSWPSLRYLGGERERGEGRGIGCEREGEGEVFFGEEWGGKNGPMLQESWGIQCAIHVGPSHYNSSPFWLSQHHRR